MSLISNYRIPLIFLGINFVFLLLTFGFIVFDDKRKKNVMFVQIIIFVHGMLLLISRFLWRRFTNTFPRSTILGLMCRVFLAPVIVLGQCCFLLQHFMASAEPRILNYATGYSLVTLGMVFGLVITVDFGRLVVNALSYRREVRKLRASVVGEETAHRLAWQQLMKRTDGLGLVLVILLSACILIISHRNAEFPGARRIEVPVRNLPPSFDGLTIVQLSDIHVGAVVGRRDVKRLVSAVNEMKPDLIVLTGDAVESTVAAIGEAIRPLSSLSAKYGIFVTPGNHDYYSMEIEKWMEFWSSLGLTILRNKRVNIQHSKFKHDKFYLAGLDDPEGKFVRGPAYGPRFTKALKGRDEFTPTVLITHRPSTAKHAIQQFGNIQLALAGHTHGGQVFPLLLWHYFMEPYFNGLYQLSPDTYLYVCPGTFYAIAPLRLLTKGEITHITLTIGS